ncbi:uracil-DNA glycosylase family protein [Ningiella sp. W23]|uniref:uracil-DNA glycosylase family protein n=1 Tax=Ningiella sp. W23 TaxID=3023715 RepID=UPI003756B906
MTVSLDVQKLAQLRKEAMDCRHCQKLLPHSAKPIFIWPYKPSIILISQAPGRLAHDSGLAWNDASGERLRKWLGVDRTSFYQSGKFAVLPMSFCFPGYKNGADAPPLKPCAPMWHPRFLNTLNSQSRSSTPFLIIIGQYAQKHYLSDYKRLTDAIEDFAKLMPDHVALPHPSGRNNRWFSKHPWFESRLVPALQKQVASILNRA